MDAQRFLRDFFLAGVIVLAAALSTVGLTGPAGLVVATTSAVVFFIYISRLFRENMFFAACCMPVVFNYVWFVVSFVLFEFGAYTPELRMTGFNTGGTARLVFFLAIFLSFARLGFRLPATSKFRWYQCEVALHRLFYIFGSVAGTLVLIYLVYGTAFSNSVDRIQYRTIVVPKVYSQLITILVFLSFFLGLMRRARLERKCAVYAIDALFFLSLVLLALGGEKFSMLFTSISLYTAPQFFGIRLFFKPEKFFKFALLGAAALLGIVMLTVNQYIGIAGDGVWDVVGSLMIDRISQQGQLNFYFDKVVFVDHTTYGDLLTFIDKELLGGGSSYNGIQLLMNVAAPSDLFGIYAEAGVTFGDGFPAILFYYFGWSSTLFMAFFGYLYGVITSFCIRVSMQGRVAAGLILFYVLYNISLSAFLNGELRLLLDVTSSKLLALSLFAFVVVIHWIKRLRSSSRIN